MTALGAKRGIWARGAVGIAAVSLLAACGDKSPVPGPGEGVRVPFDASVEGLPEARPLETLSAGDGDTVRMTVSYVSKWVSGRKVRMLAYNGSVPGPILKVPQGATIVLVLENRTDLPTSLHSHGVRLEYGNDGVPGPEGAPGPGGSHAYRIRFPDPGIFWYHPHTREDYQMELGLYGAYLVTPSDTSYWPPVDREIVMFLDDIAMQGNVIRPFYRDGPDHTLMGRFGNSYLVNGDTACAFRVKRNETIRFFVVNASNTRAFNLQYSRDMDMNVVGADNGRFEYPTARESYMVAPAERYIYQLYFNDPLGDYSPLELWNANPGGVGVLARFEYGPDTAAPDLGGSILKERCEQVAASLNPYRPYFDKSPDEEIFLTGYMDMSAPMAKSSAAAHDADPSNTLGVEWNDSVHGAAMRAMNGMSRPGNMRWIIRDLRTGRENHAIDWTFRKGDKVLIRVRNDTAFGTRGDTMFHAMPHPIHFHGQRFLVLRENGKAPLEGLAWRDTYLIGRGYTVDLLLDADNPGRWMFHCHIAEHLENDMMGHFQVTEDGGPAARPYEWSLGLPWAGVDSLRRDTALAVIAGDMLLLTVQERATPGMPQVPRDTALDGKLYAAREGVSAPPGAYGFDSGGSIRVSAASLLGDSETVRLKIWVRPRDERFRPVPDTLRLALDRRGKIPWSLDLDLAGDTSFAALTDEVQAVSRMQGGVSGKVNGFDPALTLDTLYFRNMIYPEYLADAPLAADGTFSFEASDLVGALDGLHALKIFLRPRAPGRSFAPDTLRLRVSIP